MSLRSSLLLVAAAASLTFASTASQAGNYRMRVYDANTGTKVFDDGKLDGRACAVGSVATYNPATGRFATVPSAKCNFGGSASTTKTAKTAAKTAAPCPSGLVWRERFDGDTVCVLPGERDANRRNRGLSTGPASACPSGLVWRERFDGDTVCVTPLERDTNRKRRGLS